MRQHVSERKIHLTFDDGPDATWTPRILEALERADAQATFFVITPQALRHPALVGDMRHAGHRVEFHCVEHVRHPERTHQEIQSEAETGLQHLQDLGIRPSLWRTPWGKLAPRTSEVAGAAGLQIAHWTADTHDWRGDTAGTILEAVGPLLRPGAVVLMHDGLGPGARRRGCEETVSVIERLVHRIRELGCEPAPMEPADPPREAIA